MDSSVVHGLNTVAVVGAMSLDSFSTLVAKF